MNEDQLRNDRSQKEGLWGHQRKGRGHPPLQDHQSGTTQAYGNIKFILSHAGGTLPFLASRIAGGAMFNPKVREIVADPMAEVRKFWFDTALSGSGASLTALLQVADPKKILFGSDFPFAPDMAIGMNAAGVDSFPVEASVKADILQGNAVRLLGKKSS